MDFWINSIKVMSIVLAGLFGTMGLLTRYRDKNDNITRAGRVALCGIMFTALLSLALQLLQTSKESIKQRDDARRSAAEAERSAASAKATSMRLEDILKTATETSNQQRENLDEAKRLTGKMDDSLKTQGEVLSGNKRILGGVVEGAQRDAKNTVGILRTIWDEGNRVEAAQITATITYTFSSEPKDKPPLVMDSQESLSVAAVTANSGRALSFPLNRWSSGHLLERNELFLKAKQQRAFQKQYLSTGGVFYDQTSYFTDFEGDIQSFFDMTRWNGAFIEVLLTKSDSSLPGDLSKALDWNAEHERDLRHLKRRYDVPNDIEENDYQIMPLPVSARLTFYIRGRPIATSEAVLTKVREHDEDVRGLIVAKFIITKIPENTFPDFKATL